VYKPKWTKPGKTHGKASARSLTWAEAAEMAADRAEKSGKMPGRQVARSDTPGNSSEDAIVPGRPPLSGESQGGITIALAIRTPEHLEGTPELITALTPVPQATPEAQVEPPALTAPARIEQDPRRRRRAPNKLYRDSQYEL
jgi:hypothetical protein